MEKNYWLHRISHIAELSYPLLERGFLTIGFSYFTGREFINKAIEGDRDYFEAEFEKVSWGKRRKHNLWRFLHEFKKGDIVIVPSKGAFSVCEIIDEGPLLINETHSDDLKTWTNKTILTNGTHLISEEENRYDLGFARKIKILHQNISRAEFADAELIARMKIRPTNASMNILKKSIEKSIANYKEDKPIRLYSTIVEKTANPILEAIKTELSPDKFEKLVKTYFETIGANNVSIPAKNERDKEGDADVIAVFENIKLTIYIQVKFHKGETKEWEVNQVLDYKINKESIDDGYNKIAWVITSADSFGDEAQKIAVENEIQLIDGLEFSKMLLNAGINHLLDSDL